MNKIFKVIFSRAKGCYVVVSELAKSAGKGTSASHIQRGYRLPLAAAVLSMMMGMAPVGAADPVDLGNNAKAAYDDKGNLTIGDAKTVAEGDNQKGWYNTTIGTQSDTLRNVKDDTEKKGQPLDGSNTILVDEEGKAHPLDLSTEAGYSTAVGYQTHNEGDNSTAIGNNAKITNKPVTYYVDTDGKKTASPENAVWYKDTSGKPTKVPQVFRDAGGNTTATPQYVHTYTEKDPDTKEDVTKTEITSDAAKADKDSAGNPVYNYKKEDNKDKLYTVILYQAASNSIAAGTNVTANGSNAVAVGYGSTADKSAVAIGDTAAAVENAVAMGKDTTASAEGSIALGKGSQADRSGGVTGWDPKTGTTSTKTDAAWKSGEGALSIGNGGASRQITNVAAGSEDSDAVNLAQLKNAMTHYYSVKTTEATDAAGNNNYLNDGATGNNALAAGVSAVATRDNATAVGTNTYASGTNASAYGYRAVASGLNSVAIGSGTSAQQEGSVAVGGHTQGFHAVQVGTDSTAQSAYSVAVGGHAKGEYSVEVGYGSTAQGSYSTSIGGHAIGKNSIAIGSENQNSYSNPASAGGDNSIAIGGHTNSTNDIAIGAGSSTNGGQAIAVGGSATGGQAVSIGGVATNSSATAVGRNSSATGSQSTAVGGHAGNEYSTAVGQGANATYAFTTAVGNNSAASGDHSTALGYGTFAQGSNTTAIGGAKANGTNLTVIGNNSTASASYRDNISNSTAIGGAHISASDAAAIGSNATVNGQYGVALGHNSNVSASSTGVGEGTKASNTGTALGYGAQSSGYQSAAVGAGSNATGQNAVSLGGGGAWGDYSIALGSGAGTTAHGIAIGQNSGAWGENAIAIGEGTNAWRANSVVLGKNSKSGADKNIEGYDPRTGVASVDDTSTWYSTDEAVSIGRAEERDDGGNITASAITRQLNNLAAGTLDTDAVNVAQLKAATQKVNMHNYSVWSPDTETDTNYTNGGAIAKNSMAAGVSAGATGENAVAIGYGAKAKGRSATVIGKNASATGQYAMAFGGLDTTDKKGNPVTMTNTASGASATAFGQGAQAKGAASLAFGHNTVAGVDGGGQQSVAFGEDTQALGGRSLAFGEKTIAKYNDSVAFGNDTRASSTGATAFGNRTRALSSYSTAWGNATVAADEESTAWGTDTIAGAKLDANGAVTNIYTYKNNPDDKNEQAKTATEQMDVHGNLAYIQPNGKTAGIKQMKIDSGDELHDYVVLDGKDGNTYVRDYQGSLWKVNVAADGTVTVDTTAGKNGKVYNGKNGAKESLAKTTVKDAEVAITPDNVLTKAHEGSNGYNIDGYANATAFGYSTEASGDNATAFGNDTKASAAGATAFGYQTLASGENSTAFGENSIAAAKNSLAALGGTVAESATNAAAIGNGAQAKLADSVALGSGALANRSGGSKGYDVLTGNATTETSAAWVANANAIAIGNDTEGSLLTRQITGVAAGSLDTDAVNVAQLKAAGLGFTTNTKDASNTTDNYKGYKVVSRKLGDTIAIKASDETDNHSYSTKNLTTRIAENGDISILMDENPAFTSVTTSDVIFAGNPDLTDKDGKAAKADTNVHYGAKTLTDSQNITTSGNDPAATRLHYKDEQGHTYELATMDDGQIYAGDIKTDGTPDTTGFGRKMNEKTTINGGVTDKDKLTDKNIGVVSNGADTLTVKLAKDLKDLNSVTTGKTVMDDSGITITNNKTDETKNVVINGDQISFGGNQVKNMGSGSDGTDADKKPTYNTLTNGANIGDVKNIASSTVQPVIDTVNKGWELDVNSKKQKAVTPDSPKVNLIQGQNITITGDTANTDNVTIATANDVRFNTVRVGGSKTGDTYTGGIVIGKQSGGDSANPDENDYITGLQNINWDSNKIQSGRAATEDQLKKVADDIKQGTVADDVYVTGGEVAYHTDGGSDNGQPTVNDGTGKLILTENNKTSNIEITGLHDYYVTNGTVTDDGKTLELTRNDRDEKGTPQKISIDLGNVLKHDLHLVQNPEAGSNGKYTVDTKTGTVTLKVLNPNDGSGYSDITIGGFEGLGKGLKFGANKMAKDGGGNPVTNQLGSTINVTGAGTKNLQDYSGKNLMTSVEQDADGNTTIHVLMDRNISADGVTVGQAGTDGVKGKDGEVGQAGTIGINGKNGVKGDGGKEGITTTIIRTEKGQPGKDGVNGKPGVDGTDITRIVYQNSQDSQDGTDGKDTHTVATLDDGLKFAGDDGQNDASKVITKKLNERLDIVGKAKGDLTDANIGVTKDDNGKLYIQLAKHVNLDDGTLQAGDAKIGHFTNTELTTNKGNHPVDGSYTIGLSNKDWSVTDPDYVSGRAATEDQLAKVSEAINNAATAAGKRTVVTVNDKSNPATADPGANAYGEYNTQNGNLMIAAMRDSDGAMTYNIKLNDQLAIGQKGEPGVAGKDGKVTVETKGGTTVVIGHDGQDGEDGKDGISVIGKDGQNGVSIIGSNGLDGKDGIDGKISIGTLGKDGQPGKDAVSISGQNGEGHIGLTGPKGEPGADGTPGKGGISIDITTDLKTATLDDGKNVKTVIKDKEGKETTIEQAPRIQYKSGDNTYEVATMDDGQKYAGDFGDGASVKLNKTVTIKGNVAAGKTKDDFVDGNIAVVANKSQNGEDAELLIKLNKDLTGLNSATYTTSTKNGDVTTTVVDGTGLKIDNGPSITNAGIDGGKHQITNVASGKDGKMYDTAVEGHGNWNNAANIGDVTNIAKSAADGVQAKSGKNITVDANNKVNLNDNITLGDDKDKTKQVSIDGNGAKITAGDGDNKVTVDGSKGQIVAGGDNGVKIGNIAGGDSSLTIYDKDGNATNKKADGGNYVTNLGNKTWNADGTGSYVSGRAATEDQLHQVESNVNKQIADVNTKIDKVDKHHTEVTVNGGTPAKADGAYTDGNLQLKQTTGEDGQKVYDLKLNDQLKVGQKGDDGKAGKDGNVTVEAKGGTTVVIGHDGKDGKDGRDGLFVTGKDGKDGKSGVSITGPNGVAGRDGVDGKVGIAGKDGRDAVSIAGRDGVGHIGLTGPKGADGKDGTNIDISTVLGKGTLDRNQNEVKGEDKDGTKDQAARIQYQTTVKKADGTTKPITHEVATMDDGMKYGDDFGNTAKVKLNHQLDIVGDINAGKKNGDKKATKDDLSDGNIGIVATDTVYNDDGTVKENGKMTVKLAKDLKGLNSIESNSVTTGNTTINNGGLTIKTGDANRNITVQDGNVNMGGNQIHHVAPGQAPDDAVNVSQLNATNYAVNKLDTRVNRVGANAAALAALHPLDFDPDDKWDFSAGYGHYKDANAAAVGAFYRPNEDTMFSVGGSFGGGENMVNAGISVKLGQGNHVSTSRVAMAKEIKDLKKDVADLKAVVNQQSALIDKLTGVNAGELSGSDDLFPDVPANHWAYEYVTRLKQAGILTGYPDGNFAGDRMMTRYEFAAIVYRAIMAGAAANPSLNKDGTLDRLAREFSSEMKYIRIDTIRKDRNGRPTIQRVRVIKEDEKEK